MGNVQKIETTNDFIATKQTLWSIPITFKSSKLGTCLAKVNIIMLYHVWYGFMMFCGHEQAENCYTMLMEYSSDVLVP